jgi:outer membrane protein TolC
MRSLTPLLLFGLATLAHAMTWEQCVTESISHNPDIAVSAEAVRAAQASVGSSYSGYLPQLSGVSQFSHGSFGVSGTGVPGAGQPSNTTKDQFNVGLNATQNLFSGFRDRGKVREARASLENAESSLAISKAKLGFDLRTAFSQVLFGEEQARLTADILRRREGNLRLVRLRYEGGRENKGSFLLSKASFAQAEFDRAQSDRGVLVARAQLARVLGRTDPANVRAEGKLASGSAGDMPDFQAVAQTVPEYRQAKAQLLVAQAQLDQARATFFPSLDLNGSVSRQGDHFFPNTNRWSVGLNLTFPFFPGGRNIFDFEAAQANERKAELNRQSVENQLVLKLRQTYVAWLDALGQQHVAEEFLTAADERSTIARGKYTNGLMTFEDWDIIENDLISRQKSALTNRRDAVLAEAAWQQAQGKGAIP